MCGHSNIKYTIEETIIDVLSMAARNGLFIKGIILNDIDYNEYKKNMGSRFYDGELNGPICVVTIKKEDE